MSERLLNTPLGQILSQMGPSEQSKGIFDCAIPKIALSPYDIQRKYDYEITKEQAIEEGQPWVERLKTFDRAELERRLKAIETYKQESFPKLRPRYRTPQQAELLDYEMEAIRAELRQRGMRCTPLSRQLEAKIKIDCYTFEPKYTAAGVWYPSA